MMADNIVSKPLGLVLIVAAHMVLNVPGRAEQIREVKGILGNSITLQFVFNISLTQNSSFGVYTKGYTDDEKISQYKQGDVDLYPNNTSVFWHIANLTQNHNGSYWVTLLGPKGTIKSNSVQLIVREGVKSSTTQAPPMSTTMPTPEDGSFLLFYIVIVIVVLCVVLLAAVLPCLIWNLMKTEDKQPPPTQQQQQQQRSSNPTVQETVEASKNVSESSLVYSVLDFPKRPSAVLEMNPNDTEYAAVSYLTERRHM